MIIATLPRSSGSLVTPNTFAEKLASEFKDRRIVVAFGGWPACGKSKTARRLKKKVRRSCILKLSRFILPRKIRQERGLSGASPSAFDTEKIHSSIRELQQGRQLELPEYDRRLGESIGSAPVKWEAGVLILDGPIAVLDRFTEVVDFTVKFEPEHKTVWLDFAVDRDVSKRHYESGLSRKANKEKAVDVVTMLQNASLQADLTVRTLHIKRSNDYLLLYQVESGR